MSSFRILIAFVLLPFLVSGCATSGGGGGLGGLSRDATCAIIGAAAGAGTGVLVNGDVGGALIGAAGGAVMGNVICGSQASDADGDGVPDSKDKCPGTPAGVKVDRNGCPPDTDKDGVPDYKDKCVTAVGVSVDATGCAIDSDGDGVSDDDDQCPGTPAGVKVDKFGCSGDADGDGVADEKDQCPNSPAGWQVDGRGCSIPIVFRDVTFAFDSAALSKAAQEALDSKVAPVLRQNPAVKVKVVGHTDNIGTEAYNQALSVRRAKSVAGYLASHGVAASRMTTAGKGESDPIAPNSVEAGRAANRRVEIFAVK